MPYRLVGNVHGRSVIYSLVPGLHRVGSATDCDLRLADPTISRHHAEIRVAPGERLEVEIVDLSSRNGTFVAGRRISTERVTPPAEISFGRLTLLLEAVSAEDCETGVEIAPSAAPPPPSPPAGTAAATTLGTRALDVFACEELPRLLRTLLDGADAGTLAQAAGGALLRSLPLLALDVLAPGDGEPGVLYAAGREEPSPAEGRPLPPGAAEIFCRGGGFAVRAVFPSAAAGQLYRPLVDAAALLVEIAAARQELSPSPGRSARRAKEVARPECPPLPEPASLHPEMRRIYAEAVDVAAGDVGVLIRGESGTGKEILARYVHAASPRAGSAFVALNCAALPRDLLEAELFGIERGVATGVEPRPGKFELADGGTLFLDEIGDMALETQARILRALQAREVHRLGGATPRPARVRVVAATHRDLSALRAEGAFRDDLFYRIATWEVELPPLRRRRADVPNLAAHFLARAAARRNLALRGISRGALDRLVAYDWPGNIRQLENEMERAALFLTDGELLGSTRLSPEVLAGPKLPAGETLAERLLYVERAEIGKALAASDGEVAQAAELLGVGRSTLYRRMRELGLEKNS